MSDLLLELFSEEIPARMQARAAEDLKKLVTDALVAQGFLYEDARTYVTPRRLTLALHGLPTKGQDVKEERKGPRVGAPEAALAGFLKAAGLTSIDQATIQSDPKKGDSYVAIIDRPGRATTAVLAEILPAIIKAFPWPKSMRWGADSASGASFRWVRPLRAILCTFGNETEEPEVVPFEVGGLIASDITYGHRFMSDGQPIRVKRLDDYITKLEAAKVMVDPERRKQTILHEARQLCFAQGLELVEDDALADEVAGLVEWPVPLMGSFEPEFLVVPQEAVRLTIRANQKCFVVRTPSPRARGEGRGEGQGESVLAYPSPSSGAARHLLPASGEKNTLAPRFIATANVEASDGGKLIIAGNGRVIRARLSDARFFWETDQRVKLETRAEKLKTTRFHEKLGTQYERVERIAALAEEIAPLVGADPALARKAAMLAKADLATEMVGEFPELQGLMGRYYAQIEGHEPEVCAAIEEHYKPQGPGDSVPTNPVSVAVALADKLDTLISFWAIDEKPTGSKDPYALRRAALGVIRLVVENGKRLQTSKLPTYEIVVPTEKVKRLSSSHEFDASELSEIDFSSMIENISNGYVDEIDATELELVLNFAQQQLEKWTIKASVDDSTSSRSRVKVEHPMFQFIERHSDLLSFFHDRLKVMLRDQGARHDLVDAVLGAGAVSHPSPSRGGSERSEGEGGSAQAPLPSAAQPPSPQGGGIGSAQNDDLLSIVTRVNALSAFLATEDGTTLLAGTKRAVNILRAEEKKDGEGAFEGFVENTLLKETAERDLHAALVIQGAAVTAAVAKEDFAAAMTAMARLRGPVDAFLDGTFVNDPDPAIRLNRLRLLASLRRVTATVADFSKVAG